MFAFVNRSLPQKLFLEQAAQKLFHHKTFIRVLNAKHFPSAASTSQAVQDITLVEEKYRKCYNYLTKVSSFLISTFQLIWRATGELFYDLLKTKQKTSTYLKLSSMFQILFRKLKKRCLCSWASVQCDPVKSFDSSQCTLVCFERV